MEVFSFISMILFIILIVQGFKYGIVPINLFLLVFLLELIKLVITFDVSILIGLGVLILYYIGMTTYIKGLSIASLIGMLLLIVLNLLI